MSKPSAWFYVVGVVATLVGGAMSAQRGLEFAALLEKRAESLPGWSFPGSHELSLPAGELTVFARTMAYEGGLSFLPSELTVTSCTLTGSTGAPLPVKLGGKREDYTFEKVHLESIGRVTVPAAGLYTMSCAGEGSDLLAVGQMSTFWERTAVGLPSLIGFFGGIGLLVTVYLLRRRARSPAAE